MVRKAVTTNVPLSMPSDETISTNVIENSWSCDLKKIYFINNESIVTRVTWRSMIRYGNKLLCYVHL